MARSNSVPIDPWFLLLQTASLARRVRQLEKVIQGGDVTAVLGQIGDVHYRSAIDELQRARSSNQPARRVAAASHSLSTAYHAFDAIAKAGPSRTMRRFFNVEGLQNAHGQAAGSAAMVALLETYLGESVAERRTWLDRVAKHVSEDWADYYARKSNRVYSEVVGSGLDSLRFVSTFPAYFELEERLLPKELLRPRPLNWWTGHQLVERFGKEEYLRLNASGFFEGPEHNLLVYRDG